MEQKTSENSSKEDQNKIAASKLNKVPFKRSFFFVRKTKSKYSSQFLNDLVTNQVLSRLNIYYLQF